MNIIRNQIRERDAQGQLVHAGFSWVESIPSRDDFLFKFALWGFIPALVTSPIVYVWYNGGPWKYSFIDIAILAVFFVGLTAGIIATWLNFWTIWTYQQSAVTFSKSDDIWVTRDRRLFKKASHVEWLQLKYKESDISSVFSAPMKNREGGHYRHGGEHGYLAYSVLIIFNSGERFPVGQCLDEEDSQIVVAQLNIARAEMRTAISLAA